MLHTVRLMIQYLVESLAEGCLYDFISLSHYYGGFLAHKSSHLCFYLRFGGFNLGTCNVL